MTVPLSADVAGGYWETWETQTLSSVHSAFNLIYLSFLEPGTTAGAVQLQALTSPNTTANVKSGIAAKRAAGVTVLASMGGAGPSSTTNVSFTTSGHVTAFVNSVVALQSSIGPFDGIDIDLEDNAPLVSPSLVVSAMQQLRTLYPGFIVSYCAADWTWITNGPAVATALNAAGVLDVIGVMNYDWPATTDAAKLADTTTNTNYWSALISGDWTRILLGFELYPSEAANLTMTPTLAVTAWNQVLTAHPTIRGGFVWDTFDDSSQGDPFATTLAPLIIDGTQPAMPVPVLSVSGNRIVRTDTSAPVLLRGANFMRSDWTSGYGMAWENVAIPALKAWGGNLILRGFASDPVNASDSSYLAMLDAYVSLATANQMYVIFVWRSDAPDGAQPNAPDTSGQAALPILAARYKGSPAVMFGLQVEPHLTGSDWATLRPIFETMVDNIRTASSPFTPIVFVPGSNYSQDVSGAISDPVSRSNIVYKPHCYQPASAYAAQFQATFNANLAVFIGEFAPTESATMTDMNILIPYCAANGIGWAAWWMDYSGQGVDALVLSATDLTPTSPWGVLVKTSLTVVSTGGSRAVTASLSASGASSYTASGFTGWGMAI